MWHVNKSKIQSVSKIPTSNTKSGRNPQCAPVQFSTVHPHKWMLFEFKIHTTTATTITTTAAATTTANYDNNDNSTYTTLLLMLPLQLSDVKPVDEMHFLL